MNLVNPKYVLRNHLAQSAIEKAQRHDFSEVMMLFRVITNPFNEQSENEQYSLPPPPDIAKISVSCSS